MKVVHINATDAIGSTGVLVSQIKQRLTEQGHVCRIYAGSVSREGVLVGGKLGKKLHAFLSRLTGQQGYFSKIATKNMIHSLKAFKPDIVHLHNLHANYLHFPSLFQYLKQENVITFVTLHDCFFFTGKCSHYINDGCEKWKNRCEACPRLKADNVSWFFDRTSKMHKDKQKWFCALDNLHVVGVSKWISEEAKKSFLKNASSVNYVYNWVDLECFVPADATALKRDLGLEGKIVVLGVSASWTKAKGLDDFIALAKELDSRYKVVLVGNVAEEKIAGTGVVHIPPIQDATELARYYNMADVFVNASVQETFGLTTAEALACGTPCVVYNKTACPELIGEGCGYVAEDYEALKKQICSVAGGGKQSFSMRCRAYAEKMYCAQTNVDRYIDLYCSSVDLKK